VLLEWAGEEGPRFTVDEVWTSFRWVGRRWTADRRCRASIRRWCGRRAPRGQLFVVLDTDALLTPILSS